MIDAWRLQRTRRVVLAGLGLGALLWLIHQILLAVALADRGAFSLTRRALFDLIGFIALSLAFMLVYEARRRSEDQLRKLWRAVEQSPSTVMITDREGRIEYVNPKFTDLTGYSLEEVRGKNPRFLKSGETPPEEYARLWSAITAGKEWRGELHNVKKNGDLFWESAVISAIKNADGVITHFLAVKEDITARKLAEEAERDQRLLADALRHTAAALTRTLDLDEVFDRILANLEPAIAHDAAHIMLVEEGVAHVVQACNHTGQNAREDIFLRRWPVDTTPTLRRMVNTQRPILVSDTHTEPGWVRASESERVRSYISAPIVYEGHVLGFLNLDSAAPNYFTAQQAERLQAFADQAAVAIRNAQLYEAVRHYGAAMERTVIERARELEQQQAQLQAVLDSMSEGVIYRNTDGEIVYVNKALARLLRYQAGPLAPSLEEVYQNALLSIHDYPRIRADIQETLGAGQVWRSELHLRRFDGTPFDAAFTIAPVYNHQGDLIGRVTVVRDISEEKALQTQKELFLTYAAHELRTPLSNIKARLYLLHHQPERLDAHLAILDKASDNMKRLVDDLLDVVRYGQRANLLEQRQVILQQMIQGVWPHSLAEAEERGVTLQYDAPAEPLILCADVQRLGQAIVYLLTNAIHYSAPGGMVTVSVSADALPVPANALIQIYFEGVSLPLEQPEQVFEPFYRPQDLPSGHPLGLSLTIAREIIHLHGGSIQAAHADDGHRVVFTVRLALAESCARAANDGADDL